MKSERTGDFLAGSCSNFDFGQNAVGSYLNIQVTLSR